MYKLRHGIFMNYAIAATLPISPDGKDMEKIKYVYGPVMELWKCSGMFMNYSLAATPGSL
jgi:hypothetical protein